MYRENLESYTDSQGRLYIETLMPSDYIGKYKVTSDGLPIRLKVYDLTEEQKFYIPEEKNNLKLSTDDTGETGLVAYFDYYLEKDGSIITGYLQVHPFHKNKKILTNIFIFFERVIPIKASLVINEINNEYVWKAIKKLESLNVVHPKQ
jgi:hypothetical protein